MFLLIYCHIKRKITRSVFTSHKVFKTKNYQVSQILSSSKGMDVQLDYYDFDIFPKSSF